ncbi:unnamed protein product [Nippostrongylus brasiliensis]|uniref:AMP deaminase 2 (inferred by orthology to a human protein) n=1 Tax=Nippostrongylus brasiliensis TaxID=27835 RepID=A0A0N4YTV2_NIPBR|nr:unnamed protein product [Nippostrongylus brasiliensis]
MLFKDLECSKFKVVVCGDDGKLKPEFAKYYITKDQFLADTERLTQMIVDGPLKSFCYRRLSYLQNKFQLHVLLNELRELHEQKAVSHRDFYNIRKVDTHIHAASSMNQKHLLRFIKKKIRTEANTVVLEKNKQQVTMKEVFKKMGIDAYDLSVDMLDVHADRNTFHRFDKFNTNDIYKAKNMVQNFDELLDNIFTPLFEQVSGIDSVDDESKHEFVHFDRSTPPPQYYKDAENPPYNYYLFYMYANLTALNAFRRERGMSTFSLRPHCGEAGHVNHLLTGFLTSESIAHGILLRKVCFCWLHIYLPIYLKWGLNPHENAK